MTTRCFPGSRRELVCLSAIHSFFVKLSIQIVCVLSALLMPAQGQSNACGPNPETRSLLERAVVVVKGPSDFDRGLSPLLALRQRYPRDLWVSERYQDAVQQYGIEGHLRKLIEEYQVLSMQNPDDLMFSYLYARSLMGRNTPSAIQQLTEIVSQHPDYAPAHGSLAEIYGSATFHDEVKETSERAHFFELCPESAAHGSVLQQRPAALPQSSPLIDEAEALLKQRADPDRISAMAEQGIRDDEWRLQRIRPFDWYSVGYKREAQRELQTKYWRVWALEVRCQRAAGRTQKATELIGVMQQRAASLQKQSDPVYWDALATLAVLYEEGNQKDQTTQKLNLMQEFLTAHSDPLRAAQLATLRKLADKP
jgi:hypothetical protein